MLRSIHIPQPCAEDWNAMTPAAQGRHCAQCCKTVVDFTGWEVDAIAEYLTQNAENRVCGRFTADQLEQDYFIPETYIYNVFTSGLHYLRQIAAIVLFVFILSNTAGAQTTRHPAKPKKEQQALKGDVMVVEPPHLAGAPVAISQGEIQARVPAKDTVVPRPVMGKIAPCHPKPHPPVHPMGKPLIRPAK